MENKIQQANNNITELVNKIVSKEIADKGHCCLKAILFDENNRDCDDDLTCSACNYQAAQRYKEMLLEKYLVK